MTLSCFVIILTCILTVYYLYTLCNDGEILNACRPLSVCTSVTKVTGNERLNLSAISLQAKEVDERSLPTNFQRVRYYRFISSSNTLKISLHAAYMHATRST